MKIRRENRQGQRSITGRLTGAVLIPSITLLVMWFGVSAYLLYDGFYQRAVASSVREVSIPAVNGLASAQRERQLSMAYLAQPSVGLQALSAQEKQTDDGLAAMKAAATDALSNAPDAIVAQFNTLSGFVNQLPTIRAQVDAGTITVSQVYNFYNGLLDAATSLFDTQARVVPNVDAAQGGIDATSMFRATDEMSRAGSLIATGLETGSLSADDHLAFTSLVGAYHGELDKTAPFLEPGVAAGYRQLQASPAWKSLVSAENGFIERGPWTPDHDAGLPADQADWQNLTSQVTTQLTALSKQQADEVSAQALSSADGTFLAVIIGSLIALLASIAAIVVARRVSRTLVDRALVNRLAKMRDEALELAHRRLPNIVQRLRDGERVNVEAELPGLQFGTDEIGEVANAFNAAQNAAVSATVKEAQARDGVHNVFLGIAHRDQGLVHRLLKLLDAMEREEDEPERLERLFQLDHLATRARRNAENLIILGGELPGRRWRRPVPLIDILRAGVSETEQYRRVKVEYVPDVSIAGTSVADVIHLVAELVDNATAFSPPRSQVHVNATQAAKGVVIEVEDQGLGMSPEDRERANALMVTPPDFDAMAAGGDSRLGLFVIARLAARNSIDVEFRISPYGGTRAIVLVPSRVLTGHDEDLARVDAAVGRPEPAQVASGSGMPVRRNGVRASTTMRQIGALGGDEYFEPGRAQAGNAPAQLTRPIPAPSADPVDAPSPAGGKIIYGDPRHAARTPEPQPAPERPVGGTAEIAGVSDIAEMAEIEVLWPGEDVIEEQQAPAPSPRPGPLPQRRPQNHLVPQLRDEVLEETASGKGSDAEELGSAEQARSRISAIQRGSAEGREAGKDIDQ